jgi:hypothetical protein
MINKSKHLLEKLATITIINHEGNPNFWLGRLSGSERLAGEPLLSPTVTALAGRLVT